MPYFLERAEQVLDKQRYWVQRGVQFMEHATTDVDLDTLNIRELFREHVFGCFIEDHHGIASIDEIGEDNIMCETDYPHSDSTWPNCITVVKKIIGHLPPETQYKLLRGNAEKLYRFTPADIPVMAGSAVIRSVDRTCASVAVCASMYAPATVRTRRSHGRRPDRR